jgi:hypothetical protein
MGRPRKGCAQTLGSERRGFCPGSVAKARHYGARRQKCNGGDLQFMRRQQKARNRNDIEEELKQAKSPYADAEIRITASAADGWPQMNL